MEDAIHRHSHDLAASALREPACHCPVPTARVHDRTPSGKQKEGLLPTGKNFRELYTCVYKPHTC